MAETCDCLVLGGGPAGSALAWRLARLGVTVHLVDHERGPFSGPYETLLAPVRTMLERTGLAELVLPHAETDPLRHGALWDAETVVWRGDEPPGLLLRRGTFDRGLRMAAARAGAHVHAPARAVADGEGFVIASASGSCRVRPAVVVRATGRSARPRQGSVVPAGPATHAFGLVGEPAPGDRGTAVVEALPAGWVWMHAPADGEASASVLLDGERVAALGASRAIADALAPARGPMARWRNPQLRFAAIATPSLVGTDTRELRIGDAAATIDPLASQGVEKALAAADHALAVVTTVLRHPAWRARLFTLHGRWEAGLFEAHVAQARRWYQRVERFAAEPFWARRRGPETTSAPIADDVPLQIATNLQRDQVLVRRGDGFVECEGARDLRTGDERSHVGYVPITALLDRFAEVSSVLQATVAAGADPRLHVLPPRAVHAALRALVAAGWLTPATNATGSR